jgi:hypothetical protein
MMGERRVMQEALFYGFSLERRVPDDHLLRKIDRFVDLSEVRAHLEPDYSDVGRPSIKIARSVHEAARDKARAIAKTEAYAVSCRERTIASTNEGWDRSRRDIGESPSEVKPRESNPPHSCKDL